MSYVASSHLFPSYYDMGKTKKFTKHSFCPFWEIDFTSTINSISRKYNRANNRYFFHNLTLSVEKKASISNMMKCHWNNMIVWKDDIKESWIISDPSFCHYGNPWIPPTVLSNWCRSVLLVFVHERQTPRRSRRIIAHVRAARSLTVTYYIHNSYERTFRYFYGRFSSNSSVELKVSGTVGRDNTPW
jgi:hypothetical protein